ncbi:hypothetical protein G8S49_05415 [Clostridium botulinum C]|uniref:DUF2202 domain-containing protein n=2 Tax=Clostridium botulinum TaxID=1491 RepID=A0A9Q4THU2_CLOBO|nr:hypothetical protein [Clostridium botulinum]MCD3194743.1 hypothetical protein [Clostridium botulinum C]MCD3200136.1 hypothetical protein [Clostridium botulinum C]MCD3205611.1 hypothetical protein [Clostridium botulinum C]MCD3208129.1 hypothetical protein [Clostridium botulinum C]MCD3224330.1 hypothetical protein [Clostridium botulinum C]
MYNKQLYKVFIALTISLILIGCGIRTKHDNDDKQNAVFTTKSMAARGAKGAKEEKNLNLEKVLNYALEDEYMERTRCEMISDKYGEENNIAEIKMEQNTHIYKLLNLMKKNNIPLPGDKSREYLGGLPNTLSESYKLLVESKKESIEMYERFLKEYELPEDLKKVFEQLQLDCKKHMDMFSEYINKVSNKKDN